jgi:5-methyltetrahydrofolate--homocysteine methyltransferase
LDGDLTTHTKRLTKTTFRDDPFDITSRPESSYFGVAEIGRDQASDYAERKGMTLQEAERWLAPNLAYDPEQRNSDGATEVPQARSKAAR